MSASQMSSINKISAVIGTAGHIDHGKTSLVKALTGIDADRLAEEKRRGVTIDIGFAHLDFTGPRGPVRAAIVDVPGHERFIRNMLAGTTGVDMALFVVAADDGVMPQTREHLDILHLLGVKRGIFVITKSDLAAPSRLSEVKSEISALIKGTSLAGSPVVTASAATGSGIEELKRLIVDTLVRDERGFGGYLRLPVDRSFAVKGFGTVVTGTIASGQVEKGSEVLCYPGGQAVKVRGIQSLYIERDSVSSGERAALNISGVGHRDISRGVVLVSPELKPFIESAGGSGPWHVDCFFEFLSGSPVRTRSVLKVHHLTDESLATVRFFGTKEASGGVRVAGRLTLKKPLLMMRGDRFILRDPSLNLTIGGGVVRLPYLSKGLMPRPGGVKESVWKEDDGAEELLLALMDGNTGCEASGARLMLNLSKDEFIKTVSGSKKVGAIGGYVVDLEKAAEIRRAVLDAVSAFHSTNPTEAGIKEDALYRAVAGGAKKRTFKVVSPLLKEIVEAMLSDKALKRDSGRLAFYSHRTVSSGADRLIEEAILKLFAEGFSAPTADEIRALPFRKADLDRMTAYLQRQGVIVRIKEGTFMSKTALEAARVRLAERIKAAGGIKASEFRDILGCGRKLAIEVLEHFDRERVTLRKGDIRVLR